MSDAPARRTAALAIVHQPHPNAPEDQPLPRQAAGTRPAVATRCQTEVHGAVDGDAFRLTFAVGAGLGVVFHVYDRLRLDAIPRRYTVEPGKTIHATWPLTREQGCARALRIQCTRQRCWVALNTLPAALRSPL